jgi:hypothetical protein
MTETNFTISFHFLNVPIRKLKKIYVAHIFLWGSVAQGTVFSVI